MTRISEDATPRADERAGPTSDAVTMDEFASWLERGSLRIDPRDPDAVTDVEVAGIRRRARQLPVVATRPDRCDPGNEVTEVAEMVDEAGAGDAWAFGLIYDRYVDMVFRFLYFQVGNRQLAEDLTTDTFLRALKRIGSRTRGDGDPGAWLLTIARSLVADHVRSGRYRWQSTAADALGFDPPEPEAAADPTAAPDHATDALLAALRHLEPAERECLVLRLVLGSTVAGTAVVMGRSEAAVKALQHRAVRELGRLLPPGFPG